ncbi:hypothetical protein T4B_8130 [Trichinella pseudospiralis]|uniref:Uncharacterized protein n=1 Tax=Trichinella pseudospiralis TaxID=6337 RepID=A0A0V1IGY7_TRIPS|nr:hypothetical protein T4B_13235 [Trichinella pseudospiralis]KRZ26775.1 hypothetical protein T4B_8130 [Trichinella pseudospiralis]
MDDITDFHVLQDDDDDDATASSVVVVVAAAAAAATAAAVVVVVNSLSFRFISSCSICSFGVASRYNVTCKSLKNMNTTNNCQPGAMMSPGRGRIINNVRSGRLGASKTTARALMREFCREITACALIEIIGS